MLSFKGYLHRWLATATRVAPIIHDQVIDVLKTSTEAAVKQCTGGDTGRVCGFMWSSGVYDGTYGAGQQMDALGAVSSLLIDSSIAPVTNKTGGTSVGNPNAGSDDGAYNPGVLAPLTTGDKAGAGILTFVILGVAVGTFGWMSLGA
jgi:mannan endo-1,6-alpha-mannosidase